MIDEQTQPTQETTPTPLPVPRDINSVDLENKINQLTVLKQYQGKSAEEIRKTAIRKLRQKAEKKASHGNFLESLSSANRRAIHRQEEKLLEAIEDDKELARPLALQAAIFAYQLQNDASLSPRDKGDLTKAYTALIDRLETTARARRLAGRKSDETVSEIYARSIAGVRELKESRAKRQAEEDELFEQ
jgi:hypothetical protein